MAMFKNYILSALRNLKQHKGYAIINIVGLTIGLGLTILLLSFIRYELSYEEFNPKKDRIYRSVIKAKISDSKTLEAPMANGEVYDWVKSDIPEVKHVVRLDNTVHEIERDKESFQHYSGFFTDEHFFDLFNLSLKKGTVREALKPGKMVITQNMANVVFKNENPVGKTLEWNNQTLEVSAVLDEMPNNTHLNFDYLVPFSLIQNQAAHFNRNGISFYVYYLFKKGMNTEANLTKLNGFLEETMNKKFEKWGMKIDHRLQNLDDIHLGSEGFQYTITTPGSLSNIYILSALAFFIVLIAVINYINLETSRAETRSLEVGVRKVNGASRSDLIKQFIGESLVTVVIAFLLAIGLAEVLSGSFENLVNREFTHELYSIRNIVLYLSLALFIALVSGFYPAIYLSSYHPVSILKRTTKMSKGNTPLRVSLVVLQFAIASFLIIGLLMVYSQIRFVKDKKLGFDQEQVLVVRNLKEQMDGKFDVIKNNLEDETGVVHISAADGFPGSINTHSLIRKDKNQSGMMSKENRVKNNYNKTLGLQMIEGRYFSDKYKGDSSAFVLNERAVEMLGLENPVGADNIP